MEYYKFMGSEEELKWFFDHVIVKPEMNESYLMCIATRPKKLSSEERAKIQLRGEMMREQVITTRGKEMSWTFDWFKSFIYHYECPLPGMVTKSGDPYPQVSLVVYFYVNPSDEYKVAMDSLTFTNSILCDLVCACTKDSKDGISEQLFKLRVFDRHRKTCRAANVSRNLWTQFDFDFSDEVKADPEKIATVGEKLRNAGNFFYGKGNVVVVRTSGGFHVLVHRNGMTYWGSHVRGKVKEFDEVPLPKDPVSCYLQGVQHLLERISTNNFTEEPKFPWFDEWIKTDQSFLPCPGTLQYGTFLVEVVNKEDFIVE